MSLRDQLIAKGLVSKKRARDLDREARAERKRAQGAKARKKAAEREAAAVAAAEAEAERLARSQARKAHEAERAEVEHALRVRQIVEAHRLGGRGPVRFHHRIGDTNRIGALSLPEGLARDLRVGRAAIAGFRDADGHWVHHVVSAKGAARLREVAPEALVHDVTGTDHLDDPAEAPLVATWAPSLAPHRVRDADELAVWKARS